MSSLVSTANCKLGHDCRRVRSHRRHDSTVESCRRCLLGIMRGVCASHRLDIRQNSSTACGVVCRQQSSHHHTTGHGNQCGSQNVINDRPNQSLSAALWFLLVLEGVQCNSKTESTGSHWLSVFSLTHKFMGPCVSNSMKNFLKETLTGVPPPPM